MVEPSSDTAALAAEPHRVILYKDDAGEWRWTRRAGNGEPVSNSLESYKRRKDALETLTDVNRPPYILVQNGPQGVVCEELIGIGIVEQTPPPVAVNGTREGMIYDAIRDFTQQWPSGWYVGTLAEYIEKYLKEHE